MTNGIFRGPMHRVVTNADKERISVAMFYGVDPEQEIGPIAHLLSEEQPAQLIQENEGQGLTSHAT